MFGLMTRRFKNYLLVFGMSLTMWAMIIAASIWLW
jgi:hypothetical protein